MKWKTLSRLLLAVTLTGILPAVSGCGSQAAYYDDARQYSTDSRKEAGITGWLLVLNSNEINAANVALRKAVTPSVRNYAVQMQNQHSQNYNRTLTIARVLHVTPVYTPHSVRLENAGINEVSRLSAYSGINFDRAYMAAMISDHKMALSKLDHKIMAVGNRILKNHLIQTRNAVKLHLEEARQIQRQL